MYLNIWNNQFERFSFKESLIIAAGSQCYIGHASLVLWTFMKNCKNLYCIKLRKGEQLENPRLPELCKMLMDQNVCCDLYSLVTERQCSCYKSDQCSSPQTLQPSILQDTFSANITHSFLLSVFWIEILKIYSVAVLREGLERLELLTIMRQATSPQPPKYCCQHTLKSWQLSTIPFTINSLLW